MELEDYLRTINVPIGPGAPPPILLKHVSQGPVRLSRPALNAVSLLVPTKPLSAQIFVGGRKARRTMRRGDVALLPANAPIELQFGEMEAVAAWIAPSALEAAARVFDPRIAGPLKLPPVHIARAPLLAALAIELCQEQARLGTRRQVYIDALATSLLSLIVKDHTEGDPAGERQPANSGDQRIRRARAYIDENLLTDLSLVEVARQSGLSLPHLTQLFRAATGHTIWQYVKRRRLQHARQLLQTSGQSVADVAASIGYLSVSHFSQSFRAEFGVGPGMLRKRAATAPPDEAS